MANHDIQLVLQEIMSDSKNYRVNIHKIWPFIDNVSQYDFIDIILLDKNSKTEQINFVNDICWLMRRNQDFAYLIIDKLGNKKEDIFFSHNLFWHVKTFTNMLIANKDNLNRSANVWFEKNGNSYFIDKERSGKNFYLKNRILADIYTTHEATILNKNKDLLSLSEREQLTQQCMKQLFIHKDIEYLFCNKEWFKETTEKNPVNKDGLDIFLEFIVSLPNKEYPKVYKRLHKEMKNNDLIEYMNNRENSFLVEIMQGQVLPSVSLIKILHKILPESFNQSQRSMLNEYPHLIKDKNFDYKKYKNIFGSQYLLGDEQQQNALAENLLNKNTRITIFKAGTEFKSNIVKNVEIILQEEKELCPLLKWSLLLLNINNLESHFIYFKDIHNLVEYMNPYEDLTKMKDIIVKSNLFKLISLYSNEETFKEFEKFLEVACEREKISKSVDNLNKNLKNHRL